LSATPGDNWLDYVPLMVANGFYKNRTEFIRKHVVFKPFSPYPKIEKYIGEEYLIKIRDSLLIEMNFVKRTKRHDKLVYLDFNKEQIQTLLIDRWNFFSNKPVKNIGELCYLQRKVVNSDLSRLVYLKTLLDDKKKIILFYNFDYELFLLRDFLQNNKIRYAEWNGHKHEQVPTGQCWIYLCQYTSAGEAWNNTDTDTIVLFSQNYSYKVLEQAKGRIDRLNTPFEDLYYYHFLSTSQIDLSIRRAIKEKKVFNDSMFHNF